MIESAQIRQNQQKTKERKKITGGKKGQNLFQTNGFGFKYRQLHLLYQIFISILQFYNFHIKKTIFNINMEMSPKNKRKAYDKNGFECWEKDKNVLLYLEDQAAQKQRINDWSLLCPKLVVMLKGGKQSQQMLINYLRKGVADSYRQQVWPAIIQPPISSFAECRGKIDNKQVSLDLQRTFPTHRQAKILEVQMKMVLNALVIALPDLGYCQGMNFIVGTLLLRLKQEDAFNVAYHIFHWQKHDRLLKDLSSIHQWLYALEKLIQKRFPRVSSHLSKFEIDPIIYASSWFITLYCNSLPACYTLRIIDCFLLEGEKILYRVALQILKWKKKELKKIHTIQRIVQQLKNYDQLNEGNVDLFFDQMFQIPLSRSQITQYKQDYRKRISIQKKY